MNLFRDEDGFLDISDYIDIYDIAIGYSDFDYNGKHYYFKRIYRTDMYYDELIAEEIAKDMGIECCHYDLATIGDGIYGVISESREDEFERVEPLTSIFKGLPEESNYSLTLEDVWDIISIKCDDKEVVCTFVNDYVKLFMYDCIIANPDRHSSNTMIGYKDGKPYLYPAFDNGLICSPSSILRGYFSVGVDDNTSLEIPKRFIDISASEYRDMFERYLEVINETNLQDIFRRVEERTNSIIPEDVKNDLASKFQMNYDNLKEIIDKDIARRGR